MSLSEKNMLLLKKLFHETNGDPYVSLSIWDIGKRCGLNSGEIRSGWEYLENHGYVITRTEQGDVSITGEGTNYILNISEKHEGEIMIDIKTINEKKVFVIHGRNSKARIALFEFLRAIGLEPIEWNEAKSMTGDASPYPKDVLDVAFKTAQAIIVLITGDDVAKLKDQFIVPDDNDYERELTPQARPNVLFEAGLAFGRDPKRTILVSFKKEKTRPFSDLIGKLFVRLSNLHESRIDLISHLKTAGCTIDNFEHKKDWMVAGNFDSIFESDIIQEKVVEKIEAPKIILDNEHLFLIRTTANNDSIEYDELWDSFLEKFKNSERYHFKSKIMELNSNGYIKILTGYNGTGIVLDTPKGLKALENYDKQQKKQDR